MVMSQSQDPALEVHLDLVGGIAGDMFVAAVLDAFPHFETPVLRAIESVTAGHPVTCILNAHHDQGLRGRRFDVQEAQYSRVPFASPYPSHDHTTWKSVRETLTHSALAAGARSCAIAIFQLLAQAEAFVHGVDVDSVEFHEVGAWDSIADIVGAATLIDLIGASRWTATAAPLGSGRVLTAHGILPVPAPATTQLLLGMATLDDGIAGERVTPTGAAILRHLCLPQVKALEPPSIRTLIACGTGFGGRKLRGISNHLRVMCFQNPSDPCGGHRRIHSLEFEVDDQSGEELAAGLDRLRAHPAVLEVTQCAVYGKKGRLMIHVNVLTRYAHLNEIVELCFRETTTIGLRHQLVSGIGLERRFKDVSIDSETFRVKVVHRPGGNTAKTEADSVSMHPGHAHRSALRARAEAEALRDKILDIHA